MEIFGLFGFALAGFAFFLFTLLLVAARNSSINAKLVIAACIVTSLNYVISAAQIHYLFSLKYALLLEQVKLFAWVIFVIFITRQFTSIAQFFSDKKIIKHSIVWLSTSAILWIASFTLVPGAGYLFLLFLILNLSLLVMLEQLYRNADDTGRWAIWPLVIGLASLSVFDFVVFAQAVMVSELDFNFWFSRGFIAAFICPLLLVSVRRINNGSVRVFVSRNVVFYSSMLLIAGLYLLAMALVGYIIKYMGGEWGSLVSIAFLMLGAVVLVVLLITESLRRKVKVFIAKHFFANKYEYREEWLSLIEKIETTSAESYYQMATTIMKSKLNVEQGAIVKYLTNQQYKIQYNDGVEFTPALEAELHKLAAFSQKHGWIIDIQEYVKAPSFYKGLELDIDSCMRGNISVVVPIFIGKAFYGLFVFAKAKDVEPLNWEDRDLFFAMSKQLGNFISLHEANDKLAESKQFDAFNRMSAFLVHDLKNVQAQLKLINKNAEKHRQNPDFIDDVFETIDSATTRLDKMLEQLRKKQVAQSQVSVTSINGLIQDVIKQRNVDLPVVQYTGQDSVDMQIDSETFFSVLNHLVQNAQEATQDDGSVEVCLSKSEGNVIIEIIDNGTGMTEDFISRRLFKPFDTTKGNAGMGIGVYEAKQFIEGIAGVIEVDSIVGKGSKFVITLPLNPIFEPNR